MAMPTHLPNKVWNVYRKDIPTRPDGTKAAVLQVRARDRREALTKAEDKLGPDSRGWLYVYTVTGEKAAMKLKNFGVAP